MANITNRVVLGSENVVHQTFLHLEVSFIIKRSY